MRKIEMLRKIDKPIKNCGECPNRYYSEFQGGNVCQEAHGHIITDLNRVMRVCPLPDAGVRVGCVVILVRDGKVLLGKRGEDCQTARGEYAFPGGRMDYGDTPEQSASREAFEETGLLIPEQELKFLRYVNEYFPKNEKHYVSLVFMAKCHESMGEAINKEPDKCLGWKWYDPDHIPKNTFWAVKESIQMFRWKIATA